VYVSQFIMIRYDPSKAQCVCVCAASPVALLQAVTGGPRGALFITPTSRTLRERLLSTRLFVLGAKARVRIAMCSRCCLCTPWNKQDRQEYSSSRFHIDL
jgi:hypothetical protein